MSQYMTLFEAWQHMPISVYLHLFCFNRTKEDWQTQHPRISTKQGKLKVSLPWLIEKTDTLNSEGHPITGSSEHYVLYDKLHKSNTKDPKDVLRKISLVPELQGWLNKMLTECNRINLLSYTRLKKKKENIVHFFFSWNAFLYIFYIILFYFLQC